MVEIFDLSLNVKGSKWEPDPAHPGQYRRVVYQGTGAAFANLYNKHGRPRMKRVWILPPDPLTAPQAARRETMRQAVAAWQAADAAERESARHVANTKGISLYMAYVSKYLKANHPSTGILWETLSGAWDGGTAIWAS